MSQEERWEELQLKSKQQPHLREKTTIAHFFTPLFPYSSYDSFLHFFSEIQTLQGSAVDKLMRNTIVAVRSKELIMVKREGIIAFIWGLST